MDITKKTGLSQEVLDEIIKLAKKIGLKNLNFSAQEREEIFKEQATLTLQYREEILSGFL